MFYLEDTIVKKFIVILICLAVLIPCSFASAADGEAENYTSGDYTYVLLDDGSAEIVKYTGNDKEIIIPSDLEGHPVTSIGNRAFALCADITSATIPDGVTSIGKMAFYLCNGLREITIASSVTSIGDWAFANTVLAEAAIPDSVTSIGINPFAGCLFLETIIISPDHPVLAVKDGVLFSKPDKRLVCYPQALKATRYRIPQDTAVIGSWAFTRCENLISITIPDSVISIGDGAFNFCSKLTSITIPDGVTAIGEQTFELCTGLKEITIHDSVTSIGERAFYQCAGLTSVTIPGSVTSVADLAFALCENLAEITIPNGVTSVGSYSFAATALTEVAIPDSVTEIGEGIFEECDDVTAVVGPGSYAEQYCKENGIDYICREETVPETNTAETEPAGTAEAVKAPAAGAWTCENGHEGNTGNFCPECGAAKPAEETWTCPNGHEGNTGRFCPECGAPKPELPVEINPYAEIEALVAQGEYFAAAEEALRLAQEVHQRELALEDPDELYAAALKFAEGRSLARNTAYSDSYTQKTHEYYLKAAEKGQPYAQCALAQDYTLGNGFEKSDEEAFRWYLKAAEQGYIYGISSVISCYRNGRGVEQNEKAARMWEERETAEYARILAEAEKPDITDTVILIQAGRYYKNIENNIEKAIACYEKAVEAGSGEAALMIGSMYHFGDDVEKDISKEIEWYTKAYKLGNISAARSLLNFYMIGNDETPPDLLKADAVLQEIAEQGNVYAQLQLARLLYYGDAAIGGDRVESYEWFLKAAAQNDLAAECVLGIMFEIGLYDPDYERTIIKPDPELAKAFYAISAEQGNPLAEEYLADLK